MKFICYPKCTTCQKARKWLDANGFAYDERHIVESNPSADELKDWYAKSGLALKKFFNTSGNLYKEMKLKDKLASMSEDEQIALLATNGMLVKRPILIQGDTVLVGFKEAEWAEKVSAEEAAEAPEEKKSLKDIARDYYENHDYNCAETLIRSGNDYYGLGLHDRDMRMMAVYGAGIQVGSSCGAVLGAAAVLSMMYVETTAHASADIGPVTRKLLKRFVRRYDSTLCKVIKAQSYSKTDKCMNTILEACDILQKTLEEYEGSK